MTRSLVLSLGLVACSFVAPSLAQNHVDTFPYPDGDKIPGWTQQTGSWSIEYNIVSSESASWSYLTCDALKGIRFGVFETDIFYPDSNRLCFAGAVVRYTDPKAPAEFLVSKVQDSLAKGNFSELHLYERPKGAWLTEKIKAPSRFLVLRTFVRDGDWWCELDMDRDGSFEEVSNTKRISAAVPVSGLAGVSSFNGGRINRFAYYEAMLYPVSRSPAKIGTSYSMRLEVAAERLQSSTSPTPWLGMLSAGRSGIELPGGAILPLTLDDLLVNSLLVGWAGTLTTQNRSATMTLAIPNDPNLVGLELYAAAATFGAPTPLGVGAVSNDLHVAIEQ